MRRRRTVRCGLGESHKLELKGLPETDNGRKTKGSLSVAVVEGASSVNVVVARSKLQQTKADSKSAEVECLRAFRARNSAPQCNRAPMY